MGGNQQLMMAIGGSFTFATWDPANKGPNVTLSGANLTATLPSPTAPENVLATLGKSSGKWFWKNRWQNNVDAGTFFMGFSANGISHTVEIGSTATSWAWRSDGVKINNGSTGSYGTSWGSLPVDIGCALDLGAGKCWWSLNDVWQSSGDPASGTNPAFTGISGTVFPAVSANGRIDIVANFGATALTGVPTGFNPGWYQ